MKNNYLEISQVGIEFPTDGEPFRALQNVNLTIGKGQFISLIGHSAVSYTHLTLPTKA